jgi:hypothetical protein
VALSIKWVAVDERTRFDAIVNDTADMECVTTTKALHLDIPPTLLARADEVIE